MTGNSPRSRLACAAATWTREPCGARRLRRAAGDAAVVHRRRMSKFVVRPMSVNGSWHEELTGLAEAVADLQT